MMPFGKDFNISLIIGNYVSFCLFGTDIIGKNAPKRCKNGVYTEGVSLQMFKQFLSFLNHIREFGKKTTRSNFRQSASQ
jgi:hypothetical protein